LPEPTIFTSIHFYPEDVPTKLLYPPIRAHSAMSRKTSLEFTSRKTINCTTCDQTQNDDDDDDYHEEEEEEEEEVKICELT
jgi:hypothetical protein